MLIKKIAISYPVDISATTAPGASIEVFACLSTKQDEASMPGLQDDGTIYFHALQVHMGGDGATAAESPGFVHVENGMPTYIEFDDPLPVADDTISLYVDSTTMTSALTLACKIWYSVETVSFQEALVILESYR